MAETKFTISRSGVSREFTVDIRLPEAGDIYRVNRSFNTLARCQYTEGDTLEIMGRTEKRYNFYNSLGNLKVKCQYFPDCSFWSGIELMIESKQLTLISTALDKGDTWLDEQAREIDAKPET